MDASCAEVHGIYDLSLDPFLGRNDLPPRFNIAPTQPVPILHNDNDRDHLCSRRSHGWFAQFSPRQRRSGSAKRVLFITLEDETGIANIVVMPKNYDKYRCVVPWCHDDELASVGDRDGATAAATNSIMAIKPMAAGID